MYIESWLVIYLLCGAGQVTKPLGASVFSSVNGDITCLTGSLYELDEVCPSEAFAHWECSVKVAGFFLPSPPPGGVALLMHSHQRPQLRGP